MKSLESYSTFPTSYWWDNLDFVSSLCLEIFFRAGSKINVYDPRTGVWYNEAISSGKDVVIAVDLSGSAAGTSFNIVKVTVKILIKTFQQNDFFNIVYLQNDQTHKLIDCHDKLVQTTQNNKNIYSKKLDELEEPFGETNSTNLVKHALDILNRSTNELSSANCSRVLIIVSDGLEYNSKLHDLLFQYSHLNVVVFTYLIGFTFENEFMKELAERFGGEMFNVPTVGETGCFFVETRP